MNKNTSVIMASVIVAVLAVGIAASVTQSVLAARNVAWGTDGDSGGNGGAGQTGGTADSGPAKGDNSGTADNSGINIKTGPSVIIIGESNFYESNAVGCGHIGGSGSSSENC